MSFFSPIFTSRHFLTFLLLVVAVILPLINARAIEKVSSRLEARSCATIQQSRLNFIGCACQQDCPFSGGMPTLCFNTCWQTAIQHSYGCVDPTFLSSPMHWYRPVAATGSGVVDCLGMFPDGGVP